MGQTLKGERDPEDDQCGSLKGEREAGDDIDDAGDQLVLNESFGATTTTFAHDHAGNLVDDGTFVYVYDAWNRLLKAVSSVETDVVIHMAEFDGTGRRVSKVVTNAGDLDGTEVYYYSNRWQVIEVRDGSANVLQQIYHAPSDQGGSSVQYIDEVVAERLPMGVAFVHQDANWNAIALTEQDGTWTSGELLEPGQVVSTLSGPVSVKRVRSLVITGPVVVFHARVADAATYAIGKKGIIVSGR